MDRRTEVRLNMGRRALEFSQAHLSSSPGYATALKQLEDELARSKQLINEQREGLAQVRTATIEKERLKRAIRRSHLVHLAGVAQRAAAEDAELAQKFDLPRVPPRGLAFRAAARTMVELAEQQKELLSKYGLVEELLQNAVKAVDRLDQAVDSGAEGRRIHIGASASLEVSANEVVRSVKILDGYNRFRFENDPNLLAGWVAAINIVGPAVSDGQAVGRSGGQSGSSQTPVTDAPPSSGGASNPAA
jgi:hypothetical protein